MPVRARCCCSARRLPGVPPPTRSPPPVPAPCAGAAVRQQPRRVEPADATSGVVSAGQPSVHGERAATALALWAEGAAGAAPAAADSLRAAPRAWTLVGGVG